MVKHIVMFGLQEEAEGASRSENAQKIKVALEALVDKIDCLKSMRVFINEEDSPSGNSDLMLVAELEKMEDVPVYSNHPAHQEVVAFIGKVKTSRAAIDIRL